MFKNRYQNKFDFIIADNVWEHLKYPHRATKNVYNLLNDNGYFLVIVPFLIRVHEVPIDCTRWTKDGLKFLLEESGFKIENISRIHGGIENVLLQICDQMILGLEYGFIEILKMKKIFQFKYGPLQKINFRCENNS